MEKNFIKRKNYVINRKFQFRFIATFQFYIFISLLLFSGVIFMFYWISYMMGDNVVSEFVVIYKQVPVLDDNGNPKLDEKKRPLTTTEPQPPINPVQMILPPILINNLIMMIIISILGIFYSHTIAGPAYRMQTDITRVLDGEKDVKIRLRKTDKFHELADKINQLIAEYEKCKK